ncbi:DUF6086 family protein [Streptomyces sp. NPDC059506]|uniref:DUF6086 family protein n=1 Tax=Streptomyces sp. NPDC059506 TaxID=3347751 RepID=UPI0036779730
MSQYYDMGEETLWNPSNGVSRLFLRQVAVFEAELGLASGIGPMENDESRIDPVAFGSFVDALLAWHRRTSHTIVSALSEGFVSTVLVLAERAGVEVDRAWLDDSATDPVEDVQGSSRTGMSVPPEGGSRGLRLWEESRVLSRSMPR